MAVLALLSCVLPRLGPLVVSRGLSPARPKSGPPCGRSVRLRRWCRAPGCGLATQVLLDRVPGWPGTSSLPPWQRLPPPLWDLLVLAGPPHPPGTIKSGWPFFLGGSRGGGGPRMMPLLGCLPWAVCPQPAPFYCPGWSPRPGGPAFELAVGRVTRPSNSTRLVPVAKRGASFPPSSPSVRCV